MSPLMTTITVVAVTEILLGRFRDDDATVP